MRKKILLININKKMNNENCKLNDKKGYEIYNNIYNNRNCLNSNKLKESYFF